MDLIPYTVLLSVLVAAVVYWAICSIDEEDIWSIGVVRGVDPLSLAPQSLIAAQPVLRAEHVTDTKALFVADPFLVRQPDGWLMFFEVLNERTNLGEIAYASSADGLKWQYEKLVLCEKFHLSYPQVFKCGDKYYMIPESARANSVRLYEATNFPKEWQLVTELIRGDFLDSTICRRDDGWYLFALRDKNNLALFCADKLTGPWTEHPASPISHDLATLRPGGRIVETHSGLIRVSQDGTKTYGHRLFASPITTLTRDAYAELPRLDQPLLSGTGHGWNAHGMHHLDVKQDDEHWLAAVDGKLIRKRFRVRKGARALLNLMGLSKPRMADSNRSYSSR